MAVHEPDGSSIVGALFSLLRRRSPTLFDQAVDQCYSWIKGALTFDALRQACIDPAGRAFVGVKPPTQALPSQVISQVDITCAPWATTPKIPLNSGLVAIIGARGSEKTALADIVAAGCYAITETAWNADENVSPSFLVRAKTLIGGAKVTLTWGDGSTTTRALNGDDANDPSAFPRARYLSQQFVEDLIGNEIAKTGISLHDKWGLDLTTTCLSGLLGLWADRDVALDLVLDDSKLLMDWWDEAKDLYEIRPGPSGLGSPEEYVTVEGTRSRVHFPLAAAPAFASSKVTPGLQIADVVAAVVSDAFQNKELPPNQELLQAAVAAGAIDVKCVFPDFSYVDTKRPAVRTNQQRLWELIYRSIKK